MKNLEMEFKWEANAPRTFARMLPLVRKEAQVAAPEFWQIEDVYLDLPDKFFAKHKWVLRVRHVNNAWEATFKTRSALCGGKAVRQEKTFSLPRVKNWQQALQILARKKIKKGLNLTQLQPQFILRNRRETRAVCTARMRAELAFDRCEILVCGRKLFFREIEFEFKSGRLKEWENITRALTQAGFIPARVSKVATAQALLSLWEGK